ncbi:hypothetical protein P692DRAFT_201806426 [Suillus brevipes Sb2]|nr:hypothetical protein P692DRAFT_201806426 [Suillus brevipes Sb2]
MPQQPPTPEPHPPTPEPCPPTLEPVYEIKFKRRQPPNINVEALAEIAILPKDKETFAKPRNIMEKHNMSYKTWEFQLYTFGLTPSLLYGTLPENIVLTLAETHLVLGTYYYDKNYRFELDNAHCYLYLNHPLKQTTMGKLNHIIELTGADTYSSWHSMGTDPNDFTEYASTFPVAVAAGKPTDDERNSIKDWIKEDAQAKAIIGRKLSPVIQNMLDEALSAHEQWDVLVQRFSHLDITSQFELRLQLFSEKLKDAEDAPWYLGMGVVFTDEEAIFMLLNGLSETPQWIIFRGLTISITLSTTSPAPPKITFQVIATSFLEEANCQCSQLKMVKPGSEYTNTASRSHTSGESRNNPANTPGGGTEGTKSSWGRKPSKTNLSKKDVAVSATESKPDTQQISSTSNESTPRWELACATITEISSDDSTMSEGNLVYIASQTLSTILDSRATSTLITDHNVFWTYSEKSKVTVKTANHGTLSTSGHGDCVAELSINGQVYRIHLMHCLHAPGAIINLLSVRHMLQKG